MVEYNVFKWRFDRSSAEELEETLNGHAREGWKISSIIPHIQGGGGSLMGAVDGHEATFILERTLTR
ncbi:DUF4177 domain-containing protein [Proteiniclasticum sp. BAD-10]|uniref:DUF4177 domain-containing protein n=1 Tax=Proteiniclasticum sediminis TaxID=2804028 RepID=A0A941CQD7_9CLOT|nr:DUF4177 domain-containing protein [Proteiniclasticum sediminis]MBR0576976.1 DUF4177 domain-containing protein [Proteiniclasticum sediminis]